MHPPPTLLNETMNDRGREPVKGVRISENYSVQKIIFIALSHVT